MVVPAFPAINWCLDSIRLVKIGQISGSMGSLNPVVVVKSCPLEAAHAKSSNSVNLVVVLSLETCSRSAPIKEQQGRDAAALEPCQHSLIHLIRGLIREVVRLLISC